MANPRLERVGQSLITVVVVVTLTFALIRLMPGSAVDYLKVTLADNNPDMTQDEINGLVEGYINVQPDEPLYIQYIDYVSALVTGDLGVSLYLRRPVAEIIAAATPWTVFLMGTSLFFTFAIGIIFGTLMAYHEGSKFDTSMSLLGMFLTSVPYYVAAIIFLFLSYQYGLFPTGGRMPEGVEAGLNPSFVIGVLYHAALPIISVVITNFGGWALSMRGNSIQILGEDYLRVAQLRGLSSNRIATRYLGRNAILPLYTSFAISIGFMFGGSIILEQIFSYPGLGFYMYDAVSTRDYPLMMGTFLVITLAVVIGIFIADMTYSLVDPRAGGENHETY